MTVRNCARKYCEYLRAFLHHQKDVATGLGLWVSREIVGRQGGSIKVVSPTDNGSSGSVFNVFLPISGDVDTATPDGTN